MPATLADIRRFVTEHFNDEELTALCFDHFHEVYRNFGGGATVNAKALALVDYCQRRDRLPALLAVLGNSPGVKGGSEEVGKGEMAHGQIDTIAMCCMGATEDIVPYHNRVSLKGR